MVYTPIRANFGRGRSQATTAMSLGGINRRDLPQFLDVRFAQNIQNYLVEGEGQLVKRGGQKSFFEIAGGFPITMFKKFTDNEYFFAYDDTVATVDPDTGTVTDIKTDYTSGGIFDGARYGDYFFVVNGIDSLERISRQMTAAFFYDTSGVNLLNYTGKTVDFTAAQVLTGGTSGATATINSDSDVLPATSGTLNVTAILGTFSPGETITDGLGGSATLGTINPLTLGDRITGQTSGATAIILEITGAGTASQTLTLGRLSGTFVAAETILDEETPPGQATISTIPAFVSDTVADAPIAGVVSAIGSRLFLGDLKDDETAVAYSEIDSGDVADNPPFTDWTVATLATSPGRVNFRNAGQVTSITSLSNLIIVFGKDGKWAFTITTIDSAAGLTKVDQFTMNRIDAGGERGAIRTSNGLFYVNEAGLFRLVGVGQTDVPFSDSENLTSEILGDAFIENLDFTRADLVHDTVKKYIYVTCARDSDTNNLVLAYSLEHGSFTQITGWNINRFLKDGDEIFGASSIETKGFELFTGSDDDGANIGTDYAQEISLGGLSTRKFLQGCYVQGFLSASTELKVRFDIYTREGKRVNDKLKFCWTAQLNNNGFDGYNGAHYNETAWGGDVDYANLVESFDGCRPFCRNFQRVIVHITGGDKLPHIINWLSLEATKEIPIRRRKMIECT